MSSIFSIGQMNQLANALEAAEFTPDDITKLGQFKNLSDLCGLFHGTHKLKRVRHLIDLDANPFCPDGREVVEHKKGGQLERDASRIELYLSENQEDGKWLEGNKLHKELADKPVLNANVLDHLLKNPHLIPEDWKGKEVFFWGTIYRNSDGYLVVRYLYWYGGEWDWNCYWLDDGFYGDYPAALLAS